MEPLFLDMALTEYWLEVLEATEERVSKNLFRWSKKRKLNAGKKEPAKKPAKKPANKPAKKPKKSLLAQLAELKKSVASLMEAD